MHLSHHHGPTVRTTERSRREGGYVMAMFGLLLVPLLLMAGLAVDVGSWYNRASDIQKAADAASLAGVVWLPDVAKAREVALEVAEKNGFDNDDPNITVTVNPSTRSPRRLHVTISDNRVGSFFYSNVGGNDIDIARGSFAEYVTPVPMGSPRNYFGTGRLLQGDDTELLFQSVNAFCTDKVQGDRHQSRWFGGTCAGNLNDDYKATGYELYIDAVAGRPSSIDVRLYDPRYNTGVLSTVVEAPPTCTTVEEYTYPTSTSTGWAGPDTSGTSNITITGPLQYQTRNNSTTSTYNPIVELDAGQNFTFRRDRIRYRSPAFTYPTQTTSGWTGPSGSSTVLTLRGPVQYQTRPQSSGSSWTPTPPTALATGATYALRGDRLRYRSPTYTMTPITTCVPNSTTVNENGIDMNLSGGNETYTFTLYSADSTPLDDTDNPVKCSASYASTTPFDGYEFLGSRRWNTLCSITTSDPDGKYILRVQNDGGDGGAASHANQYGVVARYTDAAGDGLCDGRTDDECPRVYGKDAISVYANAAGATASFFLAEIGPEHAGKKLKLELWDPGEGGNNIQIMRPTGSNSWTDADFEWRVGTGNVTTTDTLYVTNSQFNGRLVEITVDLTGYSPPANNNWWQIKYQFTSGATVTDRTTWSARIIGDPVHLLEEN